MLNKISAQTAQGIGSLLGQMFGGGVGQKDYAQGQLVGTQIREHKAKASLDEQQYSSIAEAIKAGVANNFKDANVYSLYGGKGTTSFDVTNQGAVFNKLTGGLNEDTSVTHAFLKLKQAEANNQNLQGDYYRSRSETERGLLNERERELIAKAALDEARAKDVTSMIAPKQKFILSQAFEKYAQGNQYNSAANYNNVRAKEVTDLTPSKLEGIAAQTFARNAQGRQFDSVAGYNNARAKEVTDLTPSKLEGIAAQTFARNAQGRQYDSVAGLNNARADEVKVLTPLAQQLKAAQTANQMGLATRNHQLAQSTPALHQSIIDKNKAQVEKAQSENRAKLLETPAIQKVMGDLEVLDQLLNQDKPNQPSMFTSPVDYWGYDVVSEREKILQQRDFLQKQLNILLNANTDPLAQAREAIANGANRAEVIRRLESLGVNPQGL